MLSASVLDIGSERHYEIKDNGGLIWSLCVQAGVPVCGCTSWYSEIEFEPSDVVKEGKPPVSDDQYEQR